MSSASGGASRCPPTARWGRSRFRRVSCPRCATCSIGSSLTCSISTSPSCLRRRSCCGSRQRNIGTPREGGFSRPTSRQQGRRARPPAFTPVAVSGEDKPFIDVFPASTGIRNGVDVDAPGAVRSRLAGRHPTSVIGRHEPRKGLLRAQGVPHPAQTGCDCRMWSSGRVRSGAGTRT